MKNIYFAISLIALIFTSCGPSQEDEKKRKEDSLKEDAKISKENDADADSIINAMGWSSDTTKTDTAKNDSANRKNQ